MSGSRAITLQLSVRDADSVRKQLEAMGEAGEKALSKLDAAAKRAANNNGMGAFRSSLSGIETSLAGATSRLGAAGQALTALGPAGLAAGAGIAAISVSMAKVASSGDQMTASMARIGAATGSIAAAQSVYEQLYQTSLKTGQSVGDSAGQFSRFALAAREIGATNSQAVKLVDTLQKATIVGGSSV